MFVGTRVPVQALIDYIEGGHSLNDFLDNFPTVTREIAVAALEQAKAHLIADARAASGVVTHIHDWYASINLVLRSAHVILRRACPTWGAHLEGLRASRRTATS